MQAFSFSAEPALWIALLNAVLVLAISFGLPVNTDQKIAIDGLLSAVLAILAGIAIRSQVAPIAKIWPPR